VKRPTGRPHPPRLVKHSTVRKDRLPRKRKPPRPRRRAAVLKPLLRQLKHAARPRQAAHIVDDDQASVLDLIDNLLAKGVMLNADLILALADVDLVYVRLSALLCAADRVLPGIRRRRGT
jgi:hypothetical protein